MKILCCTYRDWAAKIYRSTETHFFPEVFGNWYEFSHINSKNEYSEEAIDRFNPDLILWYGWSWIIPEYILNKYFCVMLHPSPLPKYRGGSPIQNQIINNESKSAVTLFKMNQGLDAGDIIYQREFSLEGELQDVLDRITKIGTSLTISMLDNFDKLNLTSQDDSNSTYFKRRTPGQSEITLEDIKKLEAEDLYNKIRALQDPYPNAFIKCKNGSKLYITNSHL